MADVTCRLTAKNQDQLRNPMLGNRVWATFTFFTLIVSIFVVQIATKTKISWPSSALTHISSLFATVICSVVNI